MRPSRKCTLDALEGRDLLSVTPILGLIAPPVVASAARSTTVITAADTTGSGTAAGGTVSAAVAPDPTNGVGQGGGNGITTDPAAPRSNEIRNRAFRGTFGGRVLELPPRLQDQQRQFYYVLPGNTNQFLHGTLQMRLYTPNATAVSPFDQITGTFSITDRSTQSGGLLLANLTGNPAQVDARGRPTQLNFFVNGGGGSGGIYSSSVGQGTVTIRYQGNVAKILIRGSIFLQGIGEPLDVYQTNLQRSL